MKHMCLVLYLENHLIAFYIIISVETMYSTFLIVSLLDWRSYILTALDFILVITDVLASHQLWPAGMPIWVSDLSAAPPLFSDVYLFKKGNSIQWANNFILVLLFNFRLYCRADVLCFLLKIFSNFWTVESLIYGLTDQLISNYFYLIIACLTQNHIKV